MAKIEHPRAQHAHGGTLAATAYGRDAMPTLEDVVELGALSYWETGPDLRYRMHLSSSAAGHRIPDEAFVGRTRWEIAGADPQCDPRWS